jgi:hypothetical protein
LASDKAIALLGRIDEAITVEVECDRGLFGRRDACQPSDKVLCERGRQKERSELTVRHDSVI